MNPILQLVTMISIFFVIAIFILIYSNYKNNSNAWGRKEI